MRREKIAYFKITLGEIFDFYDDRDKSGFRLLINGFDRVYRQVRDCFYHNCHAAYRTFMGEIRSSIITYQYWLIGVGYRHARVISMDDRVQRT